MPDEYKSTTEVLPDCRAQHHTTINRGITGTWEPIFCANCGKDGGFVPAENKQFAFYLCDPCAEKWSPLVDTYMIPDEVFWRKVEQAQLEKYQRILSQEEIALLLTDERSTLSRLAKDRPSFGGA